MRVLRSVVAPLSTLMAMRNPNVPCGRSVRSQIIGHELVWYKAHFLQQFPHQFQCSPLVPPALNKNIEDRLNLSIAGINDPKVATERFLAAAARIKSRNWLATSARKWPSSTILRLINDVGRLSP